MALLQPSHQPACWGLTDLFFEDEESPTVIYQCRTVCATCPVFEECLRYSTRNYPNVREGIFAGNPPATRRAIFNGTYELVDWRETWDPDRHVIDGLAPSTQKEPCFRHTRLKFTEGGERVCLMCGAKVRLLQTR